jgi:drug/metabolite transporter (DMT)-like permease
VLAIALALGSSVVYGLSDFLGGLKSRSVPLLHVLLVSQGTALVVLFVLVVPFGEGPPGGEFLLYAAAAGLSEAVGVAALYRGLGGGVISIVAPVAATAPLVPVVAAILLGETPSAIQGVGVGLAVAGIVLTSCERSGDEMVAGVVASSVVFGLLSALGFGCFYVAMDGASEGDVPWALLLARATAVALFVVAFLVRPSRPTIRSADLLVIASIGVLIIVADSMYAVASTEGLLGVVAVLSSLYPIVTIALAYAFLNERIDRHRQIGIATVLCGVVAISTG